MEEKSNKSVIIAIVAVLVLIAGSFGVYTVVQNNNNEKEQQAALEQAARDQAAREAEKETLVDIVALAIKARLSTLVTAVQASELVDTLQGEGPYTVLAPSNEAFDALPAGTLASLLLPENKDNLASILKYHVIAGEVMAKDLSNGQVVTTVNGGTLTVEITDAGVFFVDANGGKAKVESADVNASNGVVHVINAVLLP